MKKKMLFFFIILLSLLIVGCGKKEETIIEKDEEKIVEEEHKIAIAALCNSGSNVCLFDKDFNLISEKEIGSHYFDVYDYSLYYIKKNTLFKYDLETEEEERLDIKIEDEKYKSVTFKVEGDYLYYVFNGRKEINIINLKDNSLNKIETAKRMYNFDVLNGKIYYTETIPSKCYVCLVVNNKDNDLQVIKEITTKIESNGNYYLYRVSKQLFLYNMNDDTSINLTEEYPYDYSNLHPHIYNGTVYGVVLDTLINLKTNVNIYEFKFEEGETLNDYAFINKNKIIVLLQYESGIKYRYYIYDLEKGTREEYNENKLYKRNHVVGFEFAYIE